MTLDPKTDALFVPGDCRDLSSTPTIPFVDVRKPAPKPGDTLFVPGSAIDIDRTPTIPPVSAPKKEAENG